METEIGQFLSSGWWMLLAAMGVPSALTALLIRRVEKNMDKRARHEEERESKRMELERMLIQSTTASIALGEATARAVQRIPDAHCNGDMHAALDYAAKVKHEQKDFLTALGIQALHDD